jgi:hypothetical protein
VPGGLRSENEAAAIRAVRTDDALAAARLAACMTAAASSV